MKEFSMKKVVIIGAGFAGFWGAISAAREIRATGKSNDIFITLIAKDQFHTIKPRLYESNLEGVRIPLEQYIKPLGIQLVVDEVVSIDPDSNTIQLVQNKNSLHYDALLYAAGSELKNGDSLDQLSMFDINSYTSAQSLNAHMQKLRQKELTTDASKNIVIVGGGFTGLELATSINSENSSADSSISTYAVHLIDRNENLAQNYSEAGRQYIENCLAEKGIILHLRSEVSSYNSSVLKLSSGETINSDTVIWTTGVQANNLSKNFSQNLDETGRLTVDKYLQLENYPNVFVAGDVARVAVDEHNVSLMSCQHAMPQGKLAGHNLICYLLGADMIAYSQPEYATCLDLGGNDALLTSGWERSVQMKGVEAKQMKKNIVSQWIYPSTNLEETLKQSLPEVVE